MAAGKTFLTVLYLVLYSSFCTTEISESDVSEVEKGMTYTTDFLQGLNDVAEIFSQNEADTARGSVQNVLKVFGEFGKVAAAFGFIGAIIGFILAFLPQSDPTFEFMKEQFAEINRKLDALSLQISTLQTEMEWTNYASSYGKDENVIKNSWDKLTEFIKTAPVTSPEKDKIRLAEMFTSFYENTGTENSVANLYRYITENNSVSLNKNLLQLIIEKSNGDFNVLVQYSTYFTTLMVSGLKLNVFYYKLKGYDGKLKAREAVTQLSNTLSAIQDALIECANGFETWAEKDTVKFSTQPFSKTEKLATDIKKHFERKFHWFKWIVIVHSNEAENEISFGRSIDFSAQEKIIHLIHRGKGSAVDQNTKSNIQTILEKEISSSNDVLCSTTKENLLHRFGAKVISQTQFLHAVKKTSDYAQTDVADIELSCPLGSHDSFRDFSIFLRENIATPPCSDVKCNNGECKPIKDTTQGFCKCHKMFHGPSCEESILNIFDYAALEGEIDGLILKPVPDLTTIYFSVEELKDYTKELIGSVRHDIQWTEVIMKYNNVIQKFRYISTLHTQLKNSTITQQDYVSEVGDQFTSGGHTFQFQLTEFHHMMMGSGFRDKNNILETFRTSLSQDSSVRCTKEYSDQTDYFVRYMFALEKEAVLAWFKYLLVSGKKIDFVRKLFHDYVSLQWKLFNEKGCGPLKALDLQNNHCEKLYHSTDQQQVKMKCDGSLKPFPEIAVCSGGKWSALPVCYAEQVNGRVECKSEGGATVCKATCLPGWGSDTHPLPAEYKCSQSPCPPFKPHQCINCTKNSVCQDNEVCTAAYGTCRDACMIKRCGVNAKCSSSNHDISCTCVSPWKGNPNYGRANDIDFGCWSQDLQWVQTGGVPNNAVRSKTQFPVCRAIAPDGGWHSGYVENGLCKYEFNWIPKYAKSYEVLVDPCGGRGWRWREGVQGNMVWYAESIRFPGVNYYICSLKSNGLAGNLFNTQDGFMCHIAKFRDSRHSDFYTLVPQPCI